MAGRQRKLTRAVIESICESVEDGLPFKYAAVKAGISEGIFYHWQRQAKKEGDKAPKEILQFMKRLKESHAKFVLNTLRQVKTHSKDSWQAAAWMLERREPDTFGKIEKIEHSGSIEGQAMLAPLRKMTDEELQKEADRLRRNFERADEKDDYGESS